jgi:hypothetical protein
MNLKLVGGSFSIYWRRVAGASSGRKLILVSPNIKTNFHITMISGCGVSHVLAGLPDDVLGLIFTIHSRPNLENLFAFAAVCHRFRRLLQSREDCIIRIDSAQMSDRLRLVAAFPGLFSNWRAAKIVTSVRLPPDANWLRQFPNVRELDARENTLDQYVLEYLRDPGTGLTSVVHRPAHAPDMDESASVYGYGVVETRKDGTEIGRALTDTFEFGQRKLDQDEIEYMARMLDGTHQIDELEWCADDESGQKLLAAPGIANIERLLMVDEILPSSMHQFRSLRHIQLCDRTVTAALGARLGPVRFQIESLAGVRVSNEKHIDAVLDTFVRVRLLSLWIDSSYNYCLEHLFKRVGETRNDLEIIKVTFCGQQWWSVESVRDLAIIHLADISMLRMVGDGCGHVFVTCGHGAEAKKFELFI